MSYFANSLFTDEAERRRIKSLYPKDVLSLTECCRVCGVVSLTEEEIIDGWAKFSDSYSASWLTVDGPNGNLSGNVLRGIYLQALDVGFKASGKKRVRICENSRLV